MEIINGRPGNVLTDTQQMMYAFGDFRYTS
jgi:hypothetical protein